MDGVITGLLESTASLDTGHLRFVNKPFYDEEHLNPLDRALAAQKETGRWLRENSDPEIVWSPRIRWGAIMDVPDAKGETRSQTPIMGMGLDLLHPHSPERARLKLGESLTAGRLPASPGEILVGYQLAEILRIHPGDKVTLIGQTFDGGLATDNFTVAGFVRFGVFAMDKKMALVDLADAQTLFYMDDMVTDWLGFFPRRVSFEQYDEAKKAIESRLPSLESAPPAAWADDDQPLILSILDQRAMGAIVDKFLVVRAIIVGIFVFLMVLVLWNAGILNVIHRYGEMGLRMAMGEPPRQLIYTLVFEALVIGIMGSLAGAGVGGGFTWYMQEVGINMGDNFAQTGLMLSDVVRARLSLEGFIRGIIPGLTSSVIGTFIASLTIFNRSEANLFRELEAG